MVSDDFQRKEKSAGRKATASLGTALRSEIGSTFNRQTGSMEESRFSSKFRDGRLDRIVLTSPHYSFKSHFGSSLSGQTKGFQRKAANVKSFVRHVRGVAQTVEAHTREGGSVRSFTKNRTYKAYNHISSALNATPALQNLATALGENRIVDIVSQIHF